MPATKRLRVDQRIDTLIDATAKIRDVIANLDPATSPCLHCELKRHGRLEHHRAIEALEANLRNGDRRAGVLTLVALARNQREEGDFDTAVEHIERAASLAPYHRDVLIERLRLSAVQKRFDDILRLLAEVRGKDALDPPVLMLAALLLYAPREKRRPPTTNTPSEFPVKRSFVR